MPDRRSRLIEPEQYRVVDPSLARRGNDVAADDVSCCDSDVLRILEIERYLSNVKRRDLITGLAAAALCGGQEPAYPFVCPMDPDVRSDGPAKCRKCGMALVAGIPDSREFHVDMEVVPRLLRPDVPVRLRFVVRDPKSGKPAKLQLIHERLFHLFLISRDLGFFAHEHPERQRDSSFLFRTVLPRTGEYRVLCDVYPEGAMPQMIPRTLIVPGPSPAPNLREDLGPQQAQNLHVGLRLDPPRPLAGKKTMMFFALHPAAGLQQYLGAWGHMLAASADLIDLVHTHPAWDEVRSDVQFNLIFPRPGMYRVWVQFQRLGVVNTVAFNVPVSAI
jgi:hypothetical protein